MSAGLIGSDAPLAEAFDLALVDLDGVAYRGHEPIDHAAEGLTGARERGMHLVFVTNNASREPEDVAGQLTALDIPTVASDVMTAAQAAAQVLASRLQPGAKVLVVGGAGLRTAVLGVGMTIVESADDKPDAVVQGFAPDLAWRDLAEAAYAVGAGAWFVASNRDLSLPTARGYAPGNGALVGAVVAATGVEPDSAGKPSPRMYELAVERVGGARPLVVGDRLDTDLAGARSGGYVGLHVLTGVSTARDDILAEPHLRPHLIGEDLRSLLVAHPEPVLHDGWWTSRGIAARVSGGALELDDTHPEAGAEPVDLVRAACAAAWASADAGAPLDPAAVPDLPVGSH
ncbi:HAD-IIA family hydrolase [Sanguibacter sp. A247]|uniref:HAD-IIA family hydrolase n=1 Tax=unclassified Sanguibacter TaxID=2645534 RepID=UPI003FD6FC68